MTNISIRWFFFTETIIDEYFMPALFHVSSYTWAYIHSLILFLDFRNITQFRFKFASVIYIVIFFPNILTQFSLIKILSIKSMYIIKFWISYPRSLLLTWICVKSYIRIFNCFGKRICTLYKLYYSPARQQGIKWNAFWFKINYMYYKMRVIYTCIYIILNIISKRIIFRLSN